MKSFTILSVGLLASLGSFAAFAQAPATPPPPVKVEKNGPGPKSKAEAEAVNTLTHAQSPDEQISAAENLLTKFADTDYKSFALELEAEAYQKKNDNTKAIVYGEQALAADSGNFDADNLLAGIIANTTRDTDLNKEENLKKADKYAHDALTALELGKPPIYARVSDDQWAKIKASATEQAWQALGMVAQDRRKYDEAAADFQKGIDALPDPLLEIRMGRLLAMMKKYDDAIAWDQKVIDSGDARFKSYAEADKQRFTLSKSSAK